MHHDTDGSFWDFNLLPKGFFLLTGKKPQVNLILLGNLFMLIVTFGVVLAEL